MNYEAAIKKDPRIDWMMLGAIAGLMLVGLAFIFSASTAADANSRLWLRQAVFYGGGITIAVCICLIPYETISRFAMVGYWISIALLISVMIFGVSRYGAKRWIDLGFFQFQPSEFT